MKNVVYAPFWLLLALSCSNGSTPAPTPSRTAAPLALRTDAAVAQVDERYLAVAIDTAQVVGAKWWKPNGTVADPTTKLDPYDFTRPRLRRLAQELAPAMLRIGGTEADRVYYDMGATPVQTPPNGYLDVMTRSQWDGVAAFAKAVGFSLMFTLNAGAGPRDAGGAWTPDNARSLIDYTHSQNYPVVLWELGNEVNMFPLAMKITVSGAQLSKDAAAARALIDASDPGTKLGAPASMYWPKTGEYISLYPDFLAQGGGASIDVITWHYYPVQSSRCPITPTRASTDAMFDASTLREIDRWATEVESQRDAHAAGKQVWLGESGNAQCGGEPGVSDTFAAGFWWLDQLGRMSRHGEPFVVRQTLSGSDYGLIDETTLGPRPDYWTSVLWRRLMGTKVLDVTAGNDDALIVHAHCTRGVAGAVTLAVLNLDRTVAVTLPLGSVAAGNADQYELTSDDVTSSRIALNGRTIVPADDGSPPPLVPRTVARAKDRLDVTFAPASYGFVVLSGANATACQ